jgi:three-Cys-motif partner protein
MSGTNEEVLWDLEPATAAKHRLYQRYLDAWWPILLQPDRFGRRQPVTYLDAYAGPGVYAGGEPGSPIFALRRLLDHNARERMALDFRVRLGFIERERCRYERLLAEIEEKVGRIDALPVMVKPVHGDASTNTLAVLDQLGAWGDPVLAIFDSWGNVNVPLSTMKRIAANRSSEVIVTFGPNWFSRRESQEPEKLDAVFGGREHWQASAAEDRPDERWRQWLETYQDALRRAGFGYTLRFEIKPKTGQPLYLVFGTSHPKGLEAMKDAMWKVDDIDGESYRDPRLRDGTMVGQGTLFGDTVLHDELLTLVRQRLADGPATVEELQAWLLCETTRWRKRDAIPAIRDLREDRAVTVAPGGAVTKASRVTLTRRAA